MQTKIEIYNQIFREYGAENVSLSFPLLNTYDKISFRLGIEDILSSHTLGL